MFFFKKNNTLLKDLIPEDYVDIHSHLLPGIDDGAKNFEDTKNLISELRKIGFSKIITTPHIIDNVWNNTYEGIKEVHKKTALDLISTGHNTPFRAAAEYMMDSHFFELIKKREPLLTIKDNYVLVEMSYLQPPLQLYDMLFELQLADYIPVLAHPERYNAYHFSTNEYHKLKKAGCYFQLNLLSVVGYYGPSVLKAAHYLLNNNLIDFVGSDVHHNRHIESFKNKIVLKNNDHLKVAIQNNNLFNF